MGLKQGDYVKVNVKRKGRWKREVLNAYDGICGFVEEVLEPNGTNNVVVKFPESVILDSHKTRLGKFLEDDLEPYGIKDVLPLDETKASRVTLMTYPYLLNLVEFHSWTLTQDVSYDGYRGCIWTYGDALVGTFILNNHGAQVTIDTSALLEWW